MVEKPDEAEKKTKVAVDEAILFKLATVWPEEVHDVVARILTLASMRPSAESFVPCSVIHDDAPEKVKNEIASGNGRCFRTGVELPENGNVSFDWYEPYDRSMLFFWDVQHPVDLVVDDD